MGYEDYQRTYNPRYVQQARLHGPKPRFGTSATEILHVVVATVGLTVALFLMFERNPLREEVFSFSNLDTFGKILLAFAITATGFVLHELGHKFTAQRFGHWSEFRASPMGLALALLTAYFGFLFAAPGATWHTASGRSENGKVSAFGPLVNIFIMLAAFPFTLANPEESLAGSIAGAVLFFNGILAIFNLIPFGPLDGKKVLRWNPFVYFVLLGLAIGVFIWTNAFRFLY